MEDDDNYSCGLIQDSHTSFMHFRVTLTQRDCVYWKMDLIVVSSVQSDASRTVSNALAQTLFVEDES